MPVNSRRSLRQLFVSFPQWQKYLYVLISLAYVAISLRSPIGLLLTAGHDDGLFISNAFSIFESGWLPEYNQYVLAKGPGLSIFIAMNAILGLPITLSLALTFLASVLALARTLNRLGLPPIFSFGVFLLIVTNFSLIPTRLIRDNLYTSLTIFAVVLALELFLVTEKRKTPFHLLFILGILLGLFYLTREEFVWIIPFFSFLIGMFVWKNRKLLMDFAIWKPTSVAILGFLVPLFGVTLLNFTHYGVWQTNDFTQGSFSAVLGKLQDVRSGSESIPYVPVPKDVREQVYKVSPKFAELEQGLESDLIGWTTSGCQIYPETCGDYAGGWFAWALRDAVAHRGYYSDANTANDFYSQVIREIETACDQGSLACDSRQIPLLPRITTDAIDRSISSMQTALTFTLDQNATFSAPPSTGSPEQSAALTAFLGAPKSTPAEGTASIWVSGWYKPQSWIETVCKSEGATIQIPRLASPDLVSAFGDENLMSSRFRVDVAQLLDCSLVQQSDDGLNATEVLWRDIVSGKSQISNGMVDSIDTFETTLREDNLRDLKKVVTDNQARVLKLLFPLALISHLALLLVLISKPHYWSRVRIMALLAWAILILIGTRVLLISLINGTSFPAINESYLGPAIALMPTLCILPIFTLSQVSIDWWRQHQKTRDKDEFRKHHHNSTS